MEMMVMRFYLERVKILGESYQNKDKWFETHGFEF